MQWSCAFAVVNNHIKLSFQIGSIQFQKLETIVFNAQIILRHPIYAYKSLLCIHLYFFFPSVLTIFEKILFVLRILSLIHTCQLLYDPWCHIKKPCLHLRCFCLFCFYYFYTLSLIVTFCIFAVSLVFFFF